ncbi:MAG: class I SAM-dependent methyltransferase [Verrucomicrobia bacterium]|nr:class I SAM-dependent methyltransferase [Verrucomicrobiota bacterium]
MTAKVDVPAAYDRIAEKFFADRSTALREKRYLDRLLDGVRPGARVLDFGCGTGRPIAEHLIARGYVVTGVDGSAAMLALAQKTVPAARLVQAQLESVELTETFASIVAWDSLFHVDRRHHAEIYRKFARWLMPDGRLLLSSGGTGDPGFTDRMHGETFYYSSWTPEEVTALLGEAGFAVELGERDQTEGRGHVAILARKHP